MKPMQVALRSFLLEHPDELVVANAHRQFGKSTAMFAMACEFAIQNPGSIVKYGAPTIKQVKEILNVVNQTVLRTCPKHLRPTFKKSDGEYVFANGSVIKMIGVDIDDGNRLRGSPAHLVILDEAGFMRNLRNLVESIIEPQFLQTGGRLIMISTPSTIEAHEYVRHYFGYAKAKGTYWELRIVDNPQFTPHDVAKIVEKFASYTDDGVLVMSGEQNENYRREFMCEVFTATNLLVIPEWQHFKYTDKQSKPAHKLVVETKPPNFYRPMVTMDYGFNDHSGILLGWVDFERHKLVVCDEIFVNYKTPLEVADQILEKVKIHFPNFSLDELLLTADLQPGSLGDIRRQTGLNFTFPHKTNKDAGITALRSLITAGNIEVHPRCRNLILQLDTGIWKDELHTDWARTPHMGHLDLMDALHYMNRRAEWHKNRTPSVQVNNYDEFVPRAQPKDPTDLNRLFKRN